MPEVEILSLKDTSTLRDLLTPHSGGKANLAAIAAWLAERGFRIRGRKNLLVFLGTCEREHVARQKARELSDRAAGWVRVILTNRQA